MLRTADLLVLLTLTYAGAAIAAAGVIQCPIGTKPNGEKTPEVSEAWCEKPFDGKLVMHGPYRAWYSNGQLGNSGQYEDGQPVGKWTAWHPNGHVQGYELFKGGVIFRGQYWDERGVPASAPSK